MKYNDEDMFIRVIKQYYELGVSQKDIAEKEFISRSTVNRLINMAVSEGYVKILLNYSIESNEEYAAKLRKVFPIESAVVVPTFVDDYVLRLRDVCRALIADLLRLIDDDTIIALGWGKTMEYLAKMLENFQNTKKNVRVVQSNGCVAGEMASVASSIIIDEFQTFFGTDGYILPVPVLLDSKEMVQALLADSKVRRVFDMVLEAEVAVFSIGAFSRESVLFKRGVFDRRDYDMLESSGAIGDICSRYFDINGDIACPAMDDRTLGISYDSLREKKHRMAIAVGADKTQAAIGALRSGVVNRFYTDEMSAKDILDSI